MKTLEQKAKAYDDVIRRAKLMLDCCDSESDIISKNIVYGIIPELDESEDEKIRKALIDFFSKGAENEEQTNGISDKDILIWLEKQELKEVEPNSAWSEEDEKRYISLHNAIYVTQDCAVDSNKKKELSDFLDSLKNRVQQQSMQEWSEEDKKCTRLSTDIIDSALRAGFCVQIDRDRCVDWLKSIKERIGG